MRPSPTAGMVASRRRGWRSRWTVAVLAAVLLTSGLAMLGAARRTSVTFDEITMVALGARGFNTGRFDLMPHHPPLMQYIYGLPAYLSAPAYPDEKHASVDDRYEYARRFYGNGNDPERLALVSRLPAVAFALFLVLLTFGYARSALGIEASALAAGLVAFLPDVLAHGAIAYNDVPGALFYLAAVWGVDRAVRQPSAGRGAVAGVLIGLSLGTKLSGLVLGPVTLLLLAAEAATRRHDGEWRSQVRRAGMAALAVLYVTLVVIYRGDLMLYEFIFGVVFSILRVTGPLGSPAYLLGRVSETGWWYWYPVAFLLKTPVALHALIVVALAGWIRGWKQGGGWSSFLSMPLRSVVIGGGTYAAILLGSDLAIGFRHALPVLPFVCVIVAVGVERLWRVSGRWARVAVVALVLWYPTSALSYYPYQLSYVSEYVPGRDSGHTALLDSNLDWGQGLLELRAWMERSDVQRVKLSYFGSAMPGAYGIAYQPLPSVLDLPAGDTAANELKAAYVVIAATNLHGVYLQEDPFASYRDKSPVAILAHTLFVFDADE